ncbi:hypothetical protein [Acidovorax lacteus]|uniref:Secreted protein n=1 Tax=Acidovorax lacteus TaxID=1924988 RepID=A0ABP8KXR7_9BURK
MFLSRSRALRPAGCAAAIALAWIPQASAADATPAQAPAADARHAGAPLAHRPLSPRPLPNAQPTDSDWHAANASVGAFPRGHADIVAWEAQHGATPAEPPKAASHSHTPAAHPMQGHGHHQHHRPGGHTTTAPGMPPSHAPAGDAR